MINVNSVIVNDVTIIKDGMISLPFEVNIANVTNKELQDMLTQEGLAFTVEDVRAMFALPVVRLPLKDDVIQWVANESNKYIMAQSKKENGASYVIRACERKDYFVFKFVMRYDELHLFELLVKYAKLKSKYSRETLGLQLSRKEISREVVRMLLTIHCMTKYDLSACFVPEATEI